MHIKTDICFSLRALLKASVCDVGCYGASERLGASLAKHQWKAPGTKWVDVVLFGKCKGNRLMKTDSVMMDTIGKGQNKLGNCSTVYSEVFGYSQGKRKS